MTIYCSDPFNVLAPTWTVTTAGGGASLATDSTRIHTGGSTSVRIISIGNVTQASATRAITSTLTSDYHAQIWLNVNSGSIVDNNISVMLLGTGVLWSISCAVKYHNGAYWLQNYTGGAWQDICMISPDVWIQIDAFYNYTTGKIHYYVNASKIGGDWGSYSGAGVLTNQIYIGDTLADAGFVFDGYIWLDDLLIDDMSEAGAKTASPTEASSAAQETRKAGLSSLPLNHGARVRHLKHSDTLKPWTSS